MIAAASAEPSAEALEFHAAVRGMLAAMHATRTATFVQHQQEYVDGAWRAPQVMTVRYRAPNDVYVEWSNGQRVLWLPGHNDDRMHVDPGPMIPNLSLSPENSLAKRGQRHTIRHLGLEPVAALFEADLKLIEADPDHLAPPTVERGTLTLYGRSGRCWTADMQKAAEPRLYAARVEVCMDARSLPIRLTMWDVVDGSLRMIEQYGYEALDTSPALGDDAFEPGANGF